MHAWTWIAMSRKSFAAVHTTRGRFVTSDHYLPLKLLRWYPTASSLLDSITVTLCYTERRPGTWQVAGCSERTGQGSLWCTAVRQCHRTTTPSPLVAGASNDRLQTGTVVVQDKINGHSCIFGFSARALQIGSRTALLKQKLVDCTLSVISSVYKSLLC